jgi:eukaryotic-like serine/threonine-protein kinase
VRSVEKSVVRSVVSSFPVRVVRLPPMDSRLGSALAGHYTIDREIGRGGMAVVYLARDVRHNRNVALKVLNPELGAVLGVERFLAEIQVTANLQHPNLLPLFDSGESGGLLYYVMPYVEGESLRARLSREKQLPVDEAVRIASAIAGALDYAHRHKVIHRDLKPENVLMHEGQPLIADFGIALAVSNAGGARITQTGLSLGTPQYMSPEQATGDRVVDGRTDIYSLGAMTYEMLVGDPPHSASTSQAVIAKVLTERPRSVRTDRPNVPPHVDAAVARALEKLAADRFATAKEFADALEGRGASVAAMPVAGNVAPLRTTGRPSASRVREIAVASVAIVLAALLGWQSLRKRTNAASPVIRANFDAPPGTRITDLLTGATMAVSPDGQLLAYTTVGASTYRMWVRRVNDLTAREVAGEAGRNLTFSPNGQWIAYTEGNVVKKVAVNGGQPATVGNIGSAVPYGLSWAENDTIFVGSFSGMWHLSADGGTGSAVTGADTTPGARFGQRWPLVIPGRKQILFASGNSSTSPAHLAILDRSSGKVTEFEPLVLALLGFIDDQLIYVSPSGALNALRWDFSAGRPIGQPAQMEEGILVDPNAGAKAALSRSGTLMYLKGRAQFQAVLASPGSATLVPLIREPATYQSPRFSPDGGRVAITVFGTSATDIWVYNIARNTFERVTTEGQSTRPEWTPDGRDIVFIGDRNGKAGIWKQPADGSGPAELLYQPDFEPFEAIVSPDSQWLIVRSAPGSRYPRDIIIVPYSGERTVTPLVTGPYTESQPRVSPGGKWIAYQSNETGRFEVYVRPFPGRGGRVQVSDNVGTEPIWGRDGRKLYYRNATGDVTEVEVSTGAAFSIGTRKVVLSGDFLADASHANWDVSPSGRFLMLKRAGAEAQTIIIHNWARELREKTTAKK